MTVWQGDWRSRIYQHARAKGYASIREYAATFPQATLFELARSLGNDVAPAQVERLLRYEAIENKDIKYFAKDCLVRCIRECMPRGWDVGGDPSFLRGDAFGHWGSMFGEEYYPSLRQAWSALCSLQPPKGWLPKDPSDPLLEEIFRGVDFPLPISDI